MSLPSTYNMTDNDLEFYTKNQLYSNDKKKFLPIIGGAGTLPPPNNNNITHEKEPPRKRTRTTPQQLNVLEKSFSMNPSPNNRTREQLAHQLGMSERSIQIWFQNRRAKVKNQAKKSLTNMRDSAVHMQQQYAANAAAAACQTIAFQQGQENIDTNLYYYYYYYYFHQQQQQQYRSHSIPPLSVSASTSSSSITSDHRRLQHRSHSVGPYYRRTPPSFERPVSTLHCETLQIGTWKRVCDIQCQIQNSLVLFIGDESRGFKIEITFDLIQCIRISSGFKVEFFITNPALIRFYMRDTKWTQCHDFTQDKQASLQNVHTLTGSNQLIHDLNQLFLNQPELKPFLVDEEGLLQQHLLLLQSTLF